MKRKGFCLILWALILIALLFRLWQVGYVIDDAGFYADRWESLCGWVDVVLWGGLFAFAFCGRFLLKAHPPRPIKKNLWLGLGALAVSFFCLPQLYTDFVANVDWDAIQRGATGAIPYQLSLLYALPSALTAIGFVCIGAAQIRGRKIGYGVALLPVISELIRLVVAYTQYNGLSRVTENAVSILCMVSFLLFCLSLFWLWYQGNQTKGVFGGFAFGSTTALFGLLNTLPHWVFGNNQLPLSYLGMGAAVYALVWMGVHAFATPAACTPPPCVEEVPQTESDEASEQ